jgi:hypothetical protein
MEPRGDTSPKRQRIAKNDIRSFLTLTDIELDDGGKVGDKECQAEHQRRAGDWTDQAEKEGRGDTEEQIIGVTQNIIQSSATLDAVVRYIGVPISNNHVPILTSNNPGSRDCQAEQSEQVGTDRAEQLSKPDEQQDQVTDQSEQTEERDRLNQPLVQPEAEDDWGGLVGQAEHLLRPEAKCQAEQQNHPSLETYRAEPLDPLPEIERQAEQAKQPEAPDQAEHKDERDHLNQSLVQPEAEDDWGGLVGQAEH